MGSDARVLLIGMGTTTQSALEALTERFDVCGLVRGEFDSVTQAAAVLGVPVFGNTSPKDVCEIVDELDPDAVVVSSYDRILPAEIVSRYPFVNVHYAALPRYRGRATVNWALINGEPETAMTIHCLEPDLDAGGILVQERVAIGPRVTVADLYDELNALQRKTLGSAVQRRLEGERGTAQDESQSSYSCTRIPDDGQIDWVETTESVDRLIRALGDPFPPAFTHLGVARINVVRAHPAHEAPQYVGRIPGRVVRVDRESGEVDVLTGDGVLRLESLSVDAGEPVPAAQLLRSVRDTLGLDVGALLARVTRLEQQLLELQDKD